MKNAVRLKTNGEYIVKHGEKIKVINSEEYNIVINSRNTSLSGKPYLIYNTGFGEEDET